MEKICDSGGPGSEHTEKGSWDDLKGQLRQWLVRRHGTGRNRSRLDPVVVDRRGRRVCALQVDLSSERSSASRDAG
jgi:hypothetical protein